MTWTVSDVMTDDVVTAAPSTPFKTCVDLFRIHEIDALPVIAADRRLVGIVSEAHLLAKQAGLPVRDRHGRARRKAKAMTAGELMTTDLVTTAASTPLAAAASLMFQHHLLVLPVVDPKSRLVGMVSRSQVLKVYLRSDESIRREVARELMDVMPIESAEIAVEVKDGVVHLHGLAETPSTVELLGRVVSRVPGVVGVNDDLQLAGEPAFATTRQADDGYA